MKPTPEERAARFLAALLVYQVGEITITEWGQVLLDGEEAPDDPYEEEAFVVLWAFILGKLCPEQRKTFLSREEMDVAGKRMALHSDLLAEFSAVAAKYREQSTAASTVAGVA